MSPSTFLVLLIDRGQAMQKVHIPAPSQQARSGGVLSISRGALDLDPYLASLSRGMYNSDRQDSLDSSAKEILGSTYI